MVYLVTMGITFFCSLTFSSGIISGVRRKILLQKIWKCRNRRDRWANFPRVVASEGGANIWRGWSRRRLRSRAFQEVLDAIDMLRQLAASQKQPDSCHAPWIFTCSLMPVLVSNKGQMKVTSIFPRRRILFLVSVYTRNSHIPIDSESGFFGNVCTC